MDRDWLEAQLAAGRSFEDIGREVGRHATTVAYWAEKFELESANAGKHKGKGGLSREILEPLVAAGLTVWEIGEAVERSTATVRYWLAQHELETEMTARRKIRTPRFTARCRKHGITEFYRGRTKTGCARCRAEAVSEWRRRAKRILVEEAGGACVICGYNRCIGALEFHHRDPRTKRFALGSRGLAQAMDKLREEAKKCELLCSNCHTEVEYGITQLPFRGPAPDSPG